MARYVVQITICQTFVRIVCSWLLGGQKVRQQSPQTWFCTCAWECLHDNVDRGGGWRCAVSQPFCLGTSFISIIVLKFRSFFTYPDNAFVFFFLVELVVLKINLMGVAGMERRQKKRDRFHLRKLILIEEIDFNWSSVWDLIVYGSYSIFTIFLYMDIPLCWTCAFQKLFALRNI